MLVFSCVYSCIESPKFMCHLNNCNTSKSTIMISMFPRAVSIVCMLSKLTVMYNDLSATIKYENNIKMYEMYHPRLDADKANFRIFVIVMASLCTIIVLPVNVLRIYLLYGQFRDGSMVLFFSIMYIQTASVCITELQFIAHCFGLYQKYRSINDDMAVLKSRTIVTNRYPAVLNPGKYNSIGDSSGFNDDFCQEIKECQLVNSIESLKMRHRFVSDSASDLNDTYNLQWGLSLFILLVMMLFDIYEVMITEFNMIEMNWILYVWLLQYSFRFCMIVLIIHVTTKQALKSKILITDISNRYLDKNTKEEIQLFLNQMCSSAIEFTACDFFTLNNHLITSAIAAATTYLVILLQFN
ncbi:unnamed protein product [Macrosiphum euphorbiae]|nr:unnamed protein product [Macrosiphum euphorbiae]